MNALKPYGAYKSSGVDWLDDIPERWNVMRNKYLMREVNDRSEEGTEELLTVSQYTGVTKRSDRTSEEGELLTNAASLVGYKIVQSNDLVMNIMLAWNGSLGVSAIDGIASPAYCVFRATADIEPRYLHYLLRTSLFTSAFKTVSTGVVDSRLRLYPDVFLRLPSLVPPRDDQVAIVRYLDYMDRRIGRNVVAKQKLISLLEEQRLAIVRRAITRGLVDSEVRFKPSNISWLGDIPAHWNVRSLRSLFRTQGSGTTPSGDNYYGGGVPWVMSGDLNNAQVFVTKRTVTEDALSDLSALHAYPAGALVIAMYGATIGKTGVLGVDACTNQACCVLARPSEDANVLFVQLAVRAARQHLIQLGYGGGQPNINADIVRSLRIPCPPRHEQDSIVQLVERQCIDLDGAIDHALRSISLLLEYRRKLMVDVVTGRVDVRDVARQLPDTVATEAFPDELETLLDDSGEATAGFESPLEELVS